MVFVRHIELGELGQGRPATATMRAIENGRMAGVASTVALLEALVRPKKEGDTRLCDTYRLVFRWFPNLAVRVVDGDVAEIASELRGRYRLRTPDAVHVATAIAAGADAFVTADRDLRKVREIEILPLDDIAD